jgi:ubiquinone/menaquinone biosynthesis C-methylase UbiE
MTDSSDIRRPFFARMFLRIGGVADEKGGAEYRARTVRGLSGRVIEVGAGHGLNFPHYPHDVTEVVAIEPNPILREHAEEAAREADIKITVLPGRAESLPVEDGSFDAGVASLMLCSVSDPRVALDEFHRVIRAGGDLRFYEHVLSTNKLTATRQRVMDKVIWPMIAGGCHSARDTESTIKMSGFTIEEIERFYFKVTFGGGHTAPHILGRARRL